MAMSADKNRDVVTRAVWTRDVCGKHEIRNRSAQSLSSVSNSDDQRCDWSACDERNPLSPARSSVLIRSAPAMCSVDHTVWLSGVAQNRTRRFFACAASMIRASRASSPAGIGPSPRHRKCERQLSLISGISVAGSSLSSSDNRPSIPANRGDAAAIASCARSPLMTTLTAFS